MYVFDGRTRDTLSSYDYQYRLRIHYTHFPDDPGGALYEDGPGMDLPQPPQAGEKNLKLKPPALGESQNFIRHIFQPTEIRLVSPCDIKRDYLRNLIGMVGTNNFACRVKQPLSRLNNEE